MKCTEYRITEVIDNDNLLELGSLMFTVPSDEFTMQLCGTSVSDKIKITCENCTISCENYHVTDATELEIYTPNTYFPVVFKGKNGKFTIHNKYALSRWSSYPQVVNIEDFVYCDLYHFNQVYVRGNIDSVKDYGEHLNAFIIGNASERNYDVLGDISVFNNFPIVHLALNNLANITGNIEELDNLALNFLAIYGSKVSGDISVWANKVKGIQWTKTTEIQASNSNIIVPDGINKSHFYIHFTTGQDPVISNS